MTSRRLEKLKARLSVAETSLADLLTHVLPGVAHSGGMAFFNSEFLPDSVQPNWLPRESDHILSLAHEAVTLREEIGLPVLGTIGQLYLSACSESANDMNHNRRGPRQLATWLLGELKSIHPFQSDDDAARPR